MRKNVRFIILFTSLLILLVGSVATAFATGLPDLHPRSLSGTPVAEDGTCSVVIRMAVQNLGAGDAAAYGVRVTIVDTATKEIAFQNEFSIPGTAAGKLSSLKFVLGWLDPGKYQMVAIADPGGAMTESNETNNKNERSFTCP